MNARETPITLAGIEAACKVLGEAREALRETVARMQAEIAETTEHYRERLRSQIDTIANHHAQLLAQVESAPGLFKRPRSVQFHGVKAGWQKGKGGVDWDDDLAVCERIERLLPELADTLIKTTKKPIAAALGQLEVKDLKRIGCSVTDAGDAPFVKPVDSELDKLVKRLIEDATAEE